MTEAWFLAPVAALICGVLALAPLGHQVLARGVVFIDLAVAQAAAAAALWAGALMDHPGWISTQTLAAAGALACAAAVAWLSKKWPAEREALIGLLYVMGASVALLGARLDPHGRERLGELLAA
ncbi:MAG: metal ABC transporter permease, partial [Rubrivivax sp.]|nr:metal ABC transporter permease [Rubrivivax sp.]